MPSLVEVAVASVFIPETEKKTGTVNITLCLENDHGISNAVQLEENSVIYK